MITESHVRELVGRHSYEYKGTRYRIALERLRFDPPQETTIEPRAVDLFFSAVGIRGGETLGLHLHLGVDHAEDDEHLLEVIDHTIRQIVDGELPPGMRDLL